MAADYYETLGVSRNATPEELKRAYRKLSMTYHPDRQVGKSEVEKKAAEEKFKDINAAYACLSDPEKRTRYDQFGSEDGPQFNSFGGGTGFDPMAFFRKMHASFGFTDDSDDMFSHFGFSSGMHSSKKAYSFDSPEDGQNVQIKVKLSFKDALKGLNKKLEIDLTKECNYCHGTGVENGTTPTQCQTCNGKGKVIHTVQSGFFMQQTISECQDCNGTGYAFQHCKHCNGKRRLADKKTIIVNIPAGIDNGQRIRILGKGHCGVCGGSNGNLYILVEVEKSALFNRDGNDIYSTVSIDPIVATLGGAVEVATPYKKENVSIKPGTTSGTILKLSGKGIKTPSSTGNMFIQINIEPFVELTDKQKNMLIDFKKTVSKSNLKELQTYDKLANEFFK